MISYLCRISEKTIDEDKKPLILCDFYNLLIYPEWSHLNSLDFQRISSKNSDTQLWFKCTSETFPFGNLNNQNLYSFIHNNSEMNECSVGKYSNDNSSKHLIHHQILNYYLIILMNQQHNLIRKIQKLLLTVEILILINSKFTNSPKLTKFTFFIQHELLFLK